MKLRKRQFLSSRNPHTTEGDKHEKLHIKADNNKCASGTRYMGLWRRLITIGNMWEGCITD